MYPLSGRTVEGGADGSPGDELALCLVDLEQEFSRAATLWLGGAIAPSEIGTVRQDELNRLFALALGRLAETACETTLNHPQGAQGAMSTTICDISHTRPDS
jgi:hypothetical protein